jgi:large subunit ribosomal protein L28
MLKRCAICNKGPMYGHSLSRRGLAKKKGGTGKKTTRVTSRRFLPNLFKIKARIAGRAQTIYICAKCLKSGRVQKII